MLECLTGIGTDSGSFHAYICKQFIRSGPSFTALGIFDGDAKAVEMAKEQLIAGMNRVSFCGWDYSLIDDDVKTAFQRWVSAKIESKQAKGKRTKQ